MLMATDDEDRRLLESARRAGVRSPLLDFLLAAHALAHRDYPMASRHLAAARRRDPDSRELMRFHVLALLLSEERVAAGALARELGERDGARDERFWSWLATVLGDDGLQPSRAADQ